MDEGDKLALVIGVVIVLIIIGAAALVVFLTHKLAMAFHLPSWTLAVGGVLGLILGVFMAFFVAFDDIGKNFLAETFAPTVRLIVPDQFVGRVTVFFDPKMGHISPASDGKYIISVPASGNVLAGDFASPFARRLHIHSYLSFMAQYQDGRAGPEPLGESSGGVMGIPYCELFIGTNAEFARDYERREKEGRLFEAETILQSLRK